MPYGQKSVVGLIFQNSYGTPGSVNSVHFIPFLSDTLGVNKPPLYQENARGVFDEGDTYEGPNTVDGEISAEAQPIPLGAMLKSILNLESSTQENSASVYNHLFRPRTSDFDEKCANNPVTAYSYLDTGSAMLYSDLNGANLELNIANGELFKVKVGYVGGTFQQNASVAASFPTGKVWGWDTTSVSVGGASIDEIMDLTITLDDGGLEAQHTLNNSKEPSRIKRTDFRSVSVNGTLKFDNQNEYQEFISQSEREMVITLTGDTAISSGYKDTLTVKLPKLRYEEAKPTAEGPGQIEMAITARGKYSTTSGTALEITLTNTQATY